MRKASTLVAKIGLACLIAFSSFAMLGNGQANAQESDELPHRLMEHLHRAPVAVKTEDGVYVGWRMLGTDDPSIAFNVYRDGTKVNAHPITESTNIVDGEGTVDAIYEIRAVLNGEELPEAETTIVWNTNYKDIPLVKPADGVTPDGQTYTYRANDLSVGDLDGDGQYELIVKWDPSNARDNAQAGYTGNVYLDAYTLDGAFLWRIDMGRNIRAGAHYTQFLVYDFDGDGRAEIVVKTADGTKDGAGIVIGDPNADHRNDSGYILAGPEYLTVFDGLTGRAMVTVDYDPPRGNVSSWGDSYGNRVDRFLAGIAYLDGERPSIVMARGYYTRTVLVAYNWRDGELTKLWKFDSNDPGYESWAGQGYHSLSVADVDQDGRDEIIYGQITIDDDGTGLYNSGLGHGDALHVGDFIPSRPGLEIFGVQENSNSPYGYDMRDAATGEILWGYHTGIDTGRGATADIDPRYEGAEAWAVRGEWNSPTGGLHQASGEKISDNIPPANFVIWWDGDLLREILDHYFADSTGAGVGRIAKWDYEQGQLIDLLVAHGTLSNNHTKGTPGIQADLLGDWREEVIWRLEDSSALRLYTTTDVTEHRIYTLMHDSQYRLAIAWQNVAYNQPPHPSFFLGHGMDEPPTPRIVTKAGYGSISGFVDNGGGKQVSDAIVSLTIGGQEYSAVTNVHGYYSLHHVPLADHVLISAAKPGCEPGTAVVQVRNATVQHLDIHCPITSVTLDPAEAVVLLGDTLQLSASVSPEDASAGQLGWTSSQPEVAMVDEQGLVTALSLGNTTITAYSLADPEIQATAEIQVAGVQVEEFYLDKSNVNLLVGDTKQIKALIIPDNAFNKTILWESLDTGIATVDDQGAVTGVSLGTAVITATTEDGGLSQSVQVTVQAEAVSVSGITLDTDTYYFSSDYFSEFNPLEQPPIKRVKANVLPVDATDNDVVWSSSDESVAAVDAFGRIIAKSAGTAEIGATTIDGEYEAKARVYVPLISESFENRNEGDRWGSGTGTAGGSGNLGGAVANESGNHVFRMSGGGTGVRSTQKAFSTPITEEHVLLDFDWHVGSPANTTGAHLSIEDTAGNRYITLKYVAGEEMEYASGGAASNTAIEGMPIGTGLNVNNALYHVQVALHFTAQTIDLKLTNKATQHVAEVKDIPFDSNTSYVNNVGKIQFALVRPSGVTTSWTTWIDNFNVYALVSDEQPQPMIEVNIQNESGDVLDGEILELNAGDTLQLVAAITPPDADYRSLTWSSDQPAIAQVDPVSGLVTAIAEGDAEITLALDASSDHETVIIERSVVIRVSETDEPGDHWAKAMLTGPNQATPGEEIELIIEVTHVQQAFTTSDVTIQYDPARFEFDTLENHEGGFELAEDAVRSLRENVAVLGSAVRPQEGQLRIILASQGDTYAVSDSGPLFALYGKIRDDAALGPADVAIHKFEVSIQGEVGDVHISDAQHRTEIRIADTLALQTAIAEAQAVHDAAVEGTEPGEYPAGSKSVLQSAIQTAIAVRDDHAATQAEVDAAVIELYEAVAAFLNSVIGTPPVEADKEALVEAIARAQERLEQTVEGNKIGQYRNGSKAELQAAIDSAIIVRDNPIASQSEVDQAVDDLDEALDQYNRQLITLVEGQTQISIRDLSIVAKYLGMTSDDPNWHEIEQADLFDEGEISIRVLAAIAQMILADWLAE